MREQLLHPGRVAPRVKRGISIIIPAFNEEKVIERTLGQFGPYRERFGLEVIVSDDASNDGTAALAGPLADAVVRNDGAARGRSGAINRGVRAAAHDILVFLDADIIIADAEGFFGEVFDVFAPDDGVAGGMMDFAVYPEERTSADRLTHSFWNAVMRGALKLGWGISTPGFQMGKRDAFEAIGGFDENLRLSQDIDYSLRLSRARKFHYFERSTLLESPRRYRDEGYVIYAYRSSLRWLSILLRRRSFGEYTAVR